MMKNRIYILYVAVCAMVGTGLLSCTDDMAIEETTQISMDAHVADGDYVPGELLVKMQTDMVADADVETVVGAYTLEPVFPDDKSSAEKTQQAGLNRWYRIRFSEKVDVNVAAKRIAAVSGVEKVQVNHVARISPNRRKPVVLDAQAMKALSAQSRAASSMNDPLLFRQWGYINNGGQSFSREEAPSIAGCDLNCKEAWQMCTGDASIIVAVLDEGVMYNHPDLADNMWVNEGEELHAGRDADGNGYKDDKYGYNFVTDCGIINPYNRSNTGHGSHVAGTIAAVNNNGIGCAGIAGGDGSGNGVKIMSCQIIDGNNVCTLLNEAKAMKYAADNGAVVMQCSWGYNSSLADQLMGYTPGPATEEEWEALYPLEKEAIDYFLDTAGSKDGVIDGGIIVFASGNEYSANPAFPSAYHRCLSVSSIAADYTPSTFSNYGEAVDFSAPGGDSDYYGIPGVDDDTYDITDPTDERGMILSTLVVDEQPTYGYFEGTSMACPAVSGVVALGLSYAKQQHRHYTAEQFVQLMRETSRDLDQYYNGVKLYHYYHTMAGTTTRQMNLSNWRGKMGRLPDAGALLRAVAMGGCAMKLPNVTVAVDKDVTVNMADYYEGGTTMSFSASVADASVASATVTGSLLVVHGIAPGSTTATITAGGKQTVITITVRSKTGGYGWL